MQNETAAYIGTNDIHNNLHKCDEVRLYMVDDLETDGAYVLVTQQAAKAFLCNVRNYHDKWCMLLDEGVGSIFGPGDTFDEVVSHARPDVGTAWRNEEILQHLQCVLFDDSCALHLGVVVAGSSGEGCNEYQPGVSVQVTKQHLMEYFDEYGTENHTLCYHGDYYTVAYTGE